MVPPSSSASSSSSLAAAVDELIRSASPADRDDVGGGRRTLARALNRWRREIVPDLSRDESLRLLLPPARRSAAAGGGDVNSADDGRVDADPAASVPTALLSVVDDDGDLSTEGHREASIEILKALSRRAFAADVGRRGASEGGEGGSLSKEEEDEEVRGEEERPRRTSPIELFGRCSDTFRNRMSPRRRQIPVDDRFARRGNATDPAESSEHVRLSLVELVADLADYCYCPASFEEDEGSEQRGDEKRRNATMTMIEGTSDLCGTLSKMTLLDPCPEVQRAACRLIRVLARTCPPAVRMNAAGLLGPLTGKVDHAVGGAEKSSFLPSTLSKKCLFRHRHAKTRCAAVDASGAIALCCPNRGSSDRDDGDLEDCGAPPAAAANYFSNRGSCSTYMERMLHDTLLPGWEDLMEADPSASVQLAVLTCLGNVADVLDWGHSRNATSEDSTSPGAASAAELVPDGDGDGDPNGHSNQPASSGMDLASSVEARVLAMFLVGSSNSAQVRSAAVRQLRNVRGVGDGSPPRDAFVSHFGLMLELILAACSERWTTSKRKVRRLETLQVLLGIAIPLMEEDASLLSNAITKSIVDCLSENVLSEEREVLEAALTCCRILGSNSQYGQIIVSAITSAGENPSSARDGDDGDSAGVVATMPLESSPRRRTSVLLILDGIMGGYLRNETAASILREIGGGMAVKAPDWFRASPDLVAAISSFLCHPTTVDNLATDPEMAWALLDSCDLFVQCIRLSDRVDDEGWEPAEDAVVNILVSVAYVLGCPDGHGLSSRARSVLVSISAFRAGRDSADNASAPSLMDVHFRRVLERIASSAPPFPWKSSDPAFFATDALLRTCAGSTVASNFDLAAPFFVSHLSMTAYQKSDYDPGDTLEQCLGTTPKVELADEYSLRISLMALLQTVLSDGSFSQTAGPETTGILLSLVLPDLVWKAGGMASALRKLAAATLFSLLSHYCNKKGPALFSPDTFAHIIPILHSNLEDTESTTRELSCACLSMVLEQVSAETFAAMWETNTRAIDTLHPRLLGLLDDGHNPVRIVACRALAEFLALAHATGSARSYSLGLPELESITFGLLIQLDDPDREIQEHAFRVLSVLLELQHHDGEVDRREENRGVLDMMERKIDDSLKSHRDGTLCRLLLEKVQACRS